MRSHSQISKCNYEFEFRCSQCRLLWFATRISRVQIRSHKHTISSLWQREKKTSFTNLRTDRCASRLVSRKSAVKHTGTQRKSIKRFIFFFFRFCWSINGPQRWRSTSRKTHTVEDSHIWQRYFVAFKLWPNKFNINKRSTKCHE